MSSPETVSQSESCLNCGAPITGAFCAGCGQRDIPPYPSVRELAMDAVSEFSGWDGRLASTLRALIGHPGLLTREFLEGRRVRYISPLRLYLMASLVYFVVAASAPRRGIESSKPFGLSSTSTGDSQPASRAERVASAASASLEREEALTSAERDSAIADIQKAPALMRPVLRRAVLDPHGFKRGMLETVPRMLFALLPVFAGIVAVFYRGRKYPEHLYFAIHLHTFIFLILALAAIARFTPFTALTVGASIIAVLSIPVYATMAFRRVYGGSFGRTLLKEFAIGATYAITAVMALALAVYWVSIAT